MNLDGACSLVLKSVAGPAKSFRLCNSYSIFLASRQSEYRILLDGDGVNLPDGKRVSSFLRRRAPFAFQSKAVHIRGVDLMRKILKLTENSGTRHFFLGGTATQSEDLISWVRLTYPKLRIAGTYSPPFSGFTPQFMEKCLKSLEGAQADIVWVSLGTPKQDFVTQEIVVEAGITSIGVGAAFDYASGSRREAPKLLQRTGLEWLFRLASEPRRLWRRYVFGNIGFLRLVVLDSLRSTRGTPSRGRGTTN